jgi:hypothetical protein
MLDSAYAVSSSPHPIFGADFDNDGDIDLASASLNYGVLVLLNNGDGTFADELVFPVGTGAWSLYAADLNRDGFMDIVTPSSNNNNVYVLINNGDSTFGPAVAYPTGDGSHSVCAADFDGDGFIDLAVSDPWENKISILINNGDGTFAPQVPYPASYPRVIRAADLDSDGDLDLTSANYTNQTVSVLMNNGDGSFATQVTYYVSYEVWAVFCGDYDSDGDIDLATANHNYNTISILMNNGDGTFAPGIDYFGGIGPVFVFSAELNGDGSLDLLTANPSADNISVIFNDGSGGFALPHIYYSGNHCFSVFAADLDGDADLDLAATNAWSDDISILFNIDPHGAIAGTVTEEEAAPIQDVFVTAVSTTIDDTTDINGEYSLDSLDVGLYDVSFSHPDYRDTIVTDIEVTAEDTTILDVIMEELPGLLSGTVTDGNSQPIESVYVEINTVAVLAAESNGSDLERAAEAAVANKSEGGLLLVVVDSMYTDENGYYESVLAAGLYDILFSHDNYDDTTCINVAVTPGDTTVQDMQMVLSGCDYVVGDVNGSDNYNGLDITYGVNFFKFGTPTPQCTDCPLCEGWYYCGDVNGSCNYNGLDITYGVNYFKFGSPGPAPCGDCPPLGGYISSFQEGIVKTGTVGQAVIKRDKPIGQ